MQAAAKPSDSEHISADLPCTSCGYNLNTLSATGACPECGQPIETTLSFCGEGVRLNYLDTLRYLSNWLAWVPLGVLALLMQHIVVAALIHRHYAGGGLKSAITAGLDSALAIARFTLAGTVAVGLVHCGLFALTDKMVDAVVVPLVWRC